MKLWISAALAAVGIGALGVFAFFQMKKPHSTPIIRPSYFDSVEEMGYWAWRQTGFRHREQKAFIFGYEKDPSSARSFAKGFFSAAGLKLSKLEEFKPVAEGMLEFPKGDRTVYAVLPVELSSHLFSGARTGEWEASSGIPVMVFSILDWHEKDLAAFDRYEKACEGLSTIPDITNVDRLRCFLWVDAKKFIRGNVKGEKKPLAGSLTSIFPLENVGFTFQPEN